MKERIIIDNNQHLPRASYYVEKDGHYDVGTVNYATPETILNENRIVAVKEQVPETWEELKELCKDITVGLKICKDGTVYCCELCIAKNRTPAQMWEIIMGLLGE